MNPIECKLGPVTVNVAGDTYTFSRDDYGRFVAEVESLTHRACLLSVEHYREVERHPATSSDDIAELPAFIPGASGSTGGEQRRAAPRKNTTKA